MKFNTVFVVLEKSIGYNFIMPLGLILTILLFITGAGLAVADTSRSSEQGKLSLHNWDVASEPVVTLDGEWDFAWQKLVDPQQAFPTRVQRLHSGAPAFSPVPLRWNQLENKKNERLPAFGYATYRLRLTLPEQHPTLALFLESPATAARLWVNGVEAGRSGIVSQMADLTKAQYQNLYYEIPGNSQELEIILQIANYKLHKGGFLRPLQLGDAETLRKVFDLNQVVRYLLSGGLLLMVLYHLILFLTRRKDRIQLYFTGIASTAILRILIPGDHLLQDLFPFLSFEVIVRLEYISLLAIIAFIASFLREFFPNRIPDLFCQSLWGAAIGFGFFSLVAPLHLVTAGQIVTQIVNIIGGILLLYYTGVALYKRDEGAIFVTLTLIILFGAVFNDILHAQQLIHSFYASSYAIFILVFVQWVLMAKRYAFTFNMLLLQREQFLRSMAVAIESKDAYTGGHVDRVALFSRDLALILGWDPSDAYELYLAAMVHDVGKIGVRDLILNKPDRLSDNEMLIMQKHPGIGYHMLVDLAEMSIASEIALHHHQRWNGKGYTGLDESPPLSGDQIPMAARIVAVADFWDAISSDRPYRKAMPLEKSLHVLIGEQGVGLDPDLVRTFLQSGIWLRYLQNQPEVESCMQARTMIRNQWVETTVETGDVTCPV